MVAQSQPLITVLTDPIPVGKHFFLVKTKNSARALRDKVRSKPAYMRSAYGGHFVVTRSLVEGLQNIGVPFSYNPVSLDQVAEKVIVLSGISALRQALRLKQRGLVKTLLAGPNLVDFPSDARKWLCSPRVDICITPGPLTCRLYEEDCPELKGRCWSWPAGVDAQFWSPELESKALNKILFYVKGVDRSVVEPYISISRSAGYETEIIKYGSYDRHTYLSRLRQSALMVGFSKSESQGVAWAEAWSADVPTFMWHKINHAFNHSRAAGKTFETSTCPYLSDETGLFFRDVNEFAAQLSAWEAGSINFNARSWVLENMSDEASARRLCKLAGIEI